MTTTWWANLSKKDDNAGRVEVPESDDAKDVNDNSVDANEAEVNKANVTKDDIDSATKPIEANEANKSHAPVKILTRS